MEKVNRNPYRFLCLLALAVTAALLMLNATYGLGIREEEVNEFEHEYAVPTTTPPTTPPPTTPPPTTPPDRTIDVEVTKVWVPLGAADSHPESVEVQLYRTRNGNTSKHGNPVTLNDSNGWGYKWTALSENCAWTVEEVNVPEGYTANVTGSAGSGFTITNTKNEPPPTTPPTTTPTTPPTAPPTTPTTTPPITTPPRPSPVAPGDSGHDIFDPNIPGGGLDAPGNGSPGHGIPKTGDETDPRAWLIVMAVSAASLRYVLFHRKRTNRNESK